MATKKRKKKKVSRKIPKSKKGNKKSRKVTRKKVSKTKIIRKKVRRKVSPKIRKKRKSKTKTRAVKKSKTIVKRKKTYKVSKRTRKSKVKTKKIKARTKLTEEIKTVPEILPEFEPELLPEVPIYEIEAGSPEMFSETGIPESKDHFQNSSHASRKGIADITIAGTSRVSDIFEKAFTNALNKGPFEFDEVNIYRYGIIVRPKAAGEIPDDVKEHISQELSDIPGSAVHIVDEKGTYSLRINIGSAKESTNAQTASETLHEYSDKLARIYEYIEDIFGDTDWFTFWDTEDSMYE
jgi:hypothetical protein